MPCPLVRPFVMASGLAETVLTISARLLARYY